MADIVNATSTYSSGTIDTASTLVDNVSPHAAKHVNYPVGAIIQVETILGSGTTLKGSVADLATRLAVPLESNGKLKDFSSTTKTTFPPTVTEGCTGAASFTDGAVLLGNGNNAIQALALPASRKILSHSGAAGVDPEWVSGLLYQGPSSCGAGSSNSHSGILTVSVDGNYSGILYCTDFVLNVAKTMTVQANQRRLIIIASNSITINGTITASGAGASGYVSDSHTVESGSDQPGGGSSANVRRIFSLDGTGGGGFTASAAGLIGGAVRFGGSLIRAGGSVAGIQVTGAMVLPVGLWMEACGGGAGAEGSYETGVGVSAAGGGAGGGSIVLIAPTIVLASTATLNTTGIAGGGSASAYSGGGGAGNVYIMAKSYTDNGCTFTLTGGAAGGTGAGAGATGIKQICLYA